MYEMEGASPGHAAPSQPVAWLFPALQAARWCRIPAAETSFPIPATSPELPPERYPFPTVRVFLHASAGVAQGFAANL